MEICTVQQSLGGQSKTAGTTAHSDHNLAPSNFQLFPNLKKHLGVQWQIMIHLKNLLE